MRLASAPGQGPGLRTGQRPQGKRRKFWGIRTALQPGRLRLWKL